MPATRAQAQVETAPLPEPEPSQSTGAASLWLVILWSAREPQRIGESAYCEEGRLLVLGRAPPVQGEEAAVCFAAARPPDAGGAVVTGSEVLGEALSRRQLELRAEGGRLLVRNVGRCPMRVNDALLARGSVGPGDTIYLQQQILLLCVQRPRVWPALRDYPVARLGAFGHADEDGLVGESYALWSLRQQLTECALSEGHILIVGRSGTGKELVARALHSHSLQKKQPFVTENVATIPPNLGTALLFGNRRNFPNPGMDDRTGLIGLAEGGSLFLDEVGDMSLDAQPLLLRVMERGGHYCRLGEEAQPRRAKVRFLGATNHPERLRPELRRRFHQEIHVPDLNERREDIPLLIRHILLARAQPGQRLARYLHDGQPSIDPRLLDQLVRHSYFTHVAELAFLLEQAAMGHNQEVLLPLPPAILHRRSPAAGDARERQDSVPATGSSALAQEATPESLSAEHAQQALDQAAGSVARAATRLGISRYQLYRLISRYQLVVKRGSAAGSATAEDEDNP